MDLLALPTPIWMILVFIQPDIGGHDEIAFAVTCLIDPGDFDGEATRHQRTNLNVHKIDHSRTSRRSRNTSAFRSPQTGTPLERVPW